MLKRPLFTLTLRLISGSYFFVLFLFDEKFKYILQNILLGGDTMRKNSFLKFIRHPSFIFRKDDPEEVVVQQFVKRIYSPSSSMAKPKYKRAIKEREQRKIEIAIKRVYNPKF